MGKVKKQRTHEEEAKLPPNRRHQACGRCSYEGEYKNLKRHNKVKHPGLPLKLRNKSFGVGGAFEHLIRHGNNEIEDVSATLQTTPGK